jgi:hypothetical protein
MSPRPIVRGGQGHTAQDVIDSASGAAWRLREQRAAVTSEQWEARQRNELDEAWDAIVDESDENICPECDWQLVVSAHAVVRPKGFPRYTQCACSEGVDCS